MQKINQNRGCLAKITTNSSNQKVTMSNWPDDQRLAVQSTEHRTKSQRNWAACGCSGVAEREIYKQIKA
jgi:hypothetical protein